MRADGYVEHVYSILDDQDPYMRGWAVHFYGEQGDGVPGKVAQNS